MSRAVLCSIAFVAMLGCVPAFAVDGTVLINQASVTAAGGYPLNIIQPGSYKLSGNLVVPADTDGIHILGAGVTLDLNGFSISGPIVCDFAGQHCSTSANQSTGIFYLAVGTAIRNGRVNGFAMGIQGFQGSGIVEDIQATSNSRFGILTKDTVVRHNNVSHNGGLGIACNGCGVLENLVIFNALAGVNLGGGIFGGNVVNNNGAATFLAPSATSLHTNSCNDVGC